MLYVVAFSSISEIIACSIGKKNLENVFGNHYRSCEYHVEVPFIMVVVSFVLVNYYYGEHQAKFFQLL